MYKHIVQSKEWADFKNDYGTPAVEAGNVFYTKHKIPGREWYFAYCPRVNPEAIDSEALKESLKINKCVGLTFDVPNVVKGTPEEKNAKEIFKKYCVKSARSEFATANFLLDLTKSEKELFENMHKKHRYNTRYAAKNGIGIKLGKNNDDFEEFFELFKETAQRQNYFIRPKKYYKLIWEKFHPLDICHILTAEYQNEPLASWMVFIYDQVLYYPYGGSSEKHKNLFASNALGWEVIRFGKEKGCKIYDMWGAAENMADKEDSYYGFSRFKEKFGADHVRYINSYDLVLKKVPHLIFTRGNLLRWKLLELGLIK